MKALICQSHKKRPAVVSDPADSRKHPFPASFPPVNLA
jgi:hypothetical protein